MCVAHSHHGSGSGVGSLLLPRVSDLQRHRHAADERGRLIELEFWLPRGVQVGDVFFPAIQRRQPELIGSRNLDPIGSQPDVSRASQCHPDAHHVAGERKVGIYLLHRHDGISVAALSPPALPVQPQRNDSARRTNRRRHARQCDRARQRRDVLPSHPPLSRAPFGSRHPVGAA